MLSNASSSNCSTAGNGIVNTVVAVTIHRLRTTVSLLTIETHASRYHPAPPHTIHSTTSVSAPSLLHERISSLTDPIVVLTDTVDGFQEEVVQLYWVKEATKTSGHPLDTSLLHFLFTPTAQTAMHLHPEGSDTATTCGWEGIPCGTVQAAYSQGSQRTNIIQLDSSSATHTAENTKDPFASAIEVKGEDSTVTTSAHKIQSSTAIFEIASPSGSLVRFTSFSVSFATASDNKSTHPVFLATAGTFEFNAVPLTHSSDLCLPASLVTVQTESISPIKSCHSANTTHTSGNGSAHCATISTSHTSTLSPVSVTMCSASAACGGAVSLSRSFASDSLLFSSLQSPPFLLFRQTDTHLEKEMSSSSTAHLSNNSPPTSQINGRL